MSTTTTLTYPDHQLKYYPIAWSLIDTTSSSSTKDKRIQNANSCRSFEIGTCETIWDQDRQDAVIKPSQICSNFRVRSFNRISQAWLRCNVSNFQGSNAASGSLKGASRLIWSAIPVLFCTGNWPAPLAAELGHNAGCPTLCQSVEICRPLSKPWKKHGWPTNEIHFWRIDPIILYLYCTQARGPPYNAPVHVVLQLDQPITFKEDHTKPDLGCS